jgi:hypothetical protein
MAGLAEGQKLTFELTEHRGRQRQAGTAHIHHCTHRPLGEVAEPRITHPGYIRANKLRPASRSGCIGGHLNPDLLRVEV